MRKDEYIKELRSRLQGAKKTEIEEAIRYCEEYFFEAGEGNEQQVIDDLGMPSKFAAQIRAEATIRGVNKDIDMINSKEESEHSPLKSLLIILVGICAFPIAFPLLLAFLMLLFALFIILMVFLFTGVVVAGATLFTGLRMLLYSFVNYSNIGDASLMIGAGLLSIGLGIMLAIIAYLFVITVLPLFTKGATCIYNKAKKGRRHEEE